MKTVSARAWPPRPARTGASNSDPMRIFRYVLLPIFMLVAAPGGPPLPAPSGFVTDKADIIEEDREAQIVALLAEIERRTGTALAILTVQSTQPLDDREYASRVFDLWRIGKGGEKRGALMLVAVRDRRVQILPGQRLRRLFPEEEINAIIDERIVPEFKEGRYGLGILNGAWALSEAIAIDARIKLDFEPPRSGIDDPGSNVLSSFGKLLGLLVAFLVGGMLWFVWQDYRRQGTIKARGGPVGPPAEGEGPFRGGRGGGFGGAGRDR